MFRCIILHDTRQSLRERLAARRYNGPIRWYPVRRHGSKRELARGFYMAGGVPGDQHRMAPAGTPMDLRLRAFPTEAVFFGEDRDESYYPVVALLPRGRGFLAGATQGRGMTSFLDGTLWTDFSEAHHAAREEARIAAQIEDEWRADNPDDAEELA